MEHLPQAPRSTFVTVLAWIVIILSGLATLRGIVTNMMIATLYPPGLLAQAERSLDDAPVSFMENHVQLVYGLYLLGWAIIFVASIGLLKRKSWARVASIGLILVIMLVNLGALASNLPLLSQLARQRADFPGTAEGFMLVYSAIVNLGSTILLGWVLRRLQAEAVRREFENS